MGSRFRLAAFVAGVAVLPLAIGAIAAAAAGAAHHVFRGTRSTLSAAAVRRLSAGASKRSIIIFKNQLTNIPARKSNVQARASAVAFAQTAVRAELAQVHARNVHSFQIINPISATISSSEASRLKSNPSIQAVVGDAFRPFASLGSGPGPALPAFKGAASSPSVASTGRSRSAPATPRSRSSSLRPGPS